MDMDEDQAGSVIRRFRLEHAGATELPGASGDPGGDGSPARYQPELGLVWEQADGAEDGDVTSPENKVNTPTRLRWK